MKNAIMMNDDYTQACATKAFLNKAKYFGSPEWEEMRNFKATYPNVKVEPRTIKRNPNKTVDCRNLTYKNIEAYIKTQPNKDALLAEFKAIKAKSQIQKSPYRFVLSWFLKKFENYTEDYEKLFDTLKKKAEKDDADRNVISLPLASNQ